MEKRSKPKLGAIYLVIFLDMLGFGTIIPVIRDFTILLVDQSNLTGWDYATLSGILMSVYSVFQFVFAPLLGRLSDQHGRKPILLVSVLGNVISYFLWAVSNSFGLFLISRIISGATGGNISVAQSYIADVTTRENRAKAMGLMGAIFGLGFILGPFLGGLLSKVDISHISFGLIKFNRFSLIGIFTMSLSLINLIWISLSLREPVKNKPKFTSLKDLVNPLLLFRQFLNPVLGRLFLINFLLSIGFVHIESTLAWDLLDRFKLETSQTGYFFAYLGVVMVFIQGGIYRRVHKKGNEAKLAKIGLIFSAVALFLIPFSYPLLIMGGVIAVLAFGMGFANPSLTTLVSLNSQDENQGFNLGIVQSLGSLARALAPVSATLLYDHLAHSAPFFSASIFVFIGFLIALGLSKKIENN